MTDSTNIAYCTDLVAADEDLALSLGYAVKDDRARLAALFALQIELRRIPAAVSEPPIGEIRLQWWRDALNEAAGGDEARAHPVVQAIAATGGLSNAERRIAEELIDARAQLFYEPAFAGLDEFVGFIERAEAPLALLALMGGEDPPAEAASGLAKAYAIGRFAPQLAPAVRNDAAALVPDLIAVHAPAMTGLSPGILGRLAWLRLARGYARRPDGGPWPLAKRMAMLSAVLTGAL
jgi:phytoene synthase